jgi:hypothetical protein
LTGDSGRYVKEALSTGVLLGNLEGGGLLTGDSERQTKEGFGNGEFLSMELCVGKLEGAPLLETPNDM